LENTTLDKIVLDVVQFQQPGLDLKKRCGGLRLPRATLESFYEQFVFARLQKLEPIVE